MSSDLEPDIYAPRPSYGQLYRFSYLRNGKPAGVTLWARDMVQLRELEEQWEEIAKVQVLTVKPLGQSRFEERGGKTQLREER